MGVEAAATRLKRAENQVAFLAGLVTKMRAEMDGCEHPSYTEQLRADLMRCSVAPDARVTYKGMTAGELRRFGVER